MANHKSAKKRIRQSETRRVRNRLSAVSTRNALRTINETTDKVEAEKLFPKVIAMVDKLAKKNIIHKKKAANIKSKVQKRINKL